MEINKSSQTLNIKESSLPIFFCKKHPKYELNLVCREKQCQNLGLICAKCLEENHTNQYHNNKSFLGIDDVVNICQQIASPIFLSEHAHPAYFKEVKENNSFYKLDILCKNTIERLRSFNSKINSLIKKLELNLKENIIQIRKHAINNLGDVGELLNFIHQKYRFNEFMNTNMLIKNKSKEIMKDLSSSQIQFNSNSQTDSQIYKDTSKINMQQYQQQEEMRQKYFTNIINKITQNLSSDTKMIQIKEMNEYIQNYEQDLLDYERDVSNGIDNIIDQTTSFIKKFYFNVNKDQSQFSKEYPSYNINQIKSNQIYNNIIIYDTTICPKYIYNGNIPCWIQLIDIIKDLPLDQNFIASIKKGSVIERCLKTTTKILLENDQFLNQFTINYTKYNENDELFNDEQPKFLIYSI